MHDRDDDDVVERERHDAGMISYCYYWYGCFDGWGRE